MTDVVRNDINVTPLVDVLLIIFMLNPATGQTIQLVDVAVATKE